MPTRPIDPLLHGGLDYQTAALLQVLPRALGIGGSAEGRVLRAAGAVHGGYSLFTDYELGAVRVIPYRVHLALDAVWALALGASPFLTGGRRRGRRHWLPHVILAGYELAALALSKPGNTDTFHGSPPGLDRRNDEGARDTTPSTYDARVAQQA
ncbi:MAG TPA: hypothetical protein VHF89_19575 [Solirubrobacteraceae bacterium]|nr:hypothetical protein [Solirubrobacteraceae bacterium]